MTILFFDTETTGLIDFKADLMAPHQPRVCQLAAILTDDAGETIDEMNAIIRPDGWVVPEEAAAINHLTTERCEAEGIPMPEALARFNGLKARCTERAAFNISYDKRMLAREANLYGIPHDSEGLISHCVMQLARPICNVPPSEKMMRAGRKECKTPNMQEAYRHFFGRDFEGAHDALADVRACKDVFFAMRKLKAAA